ncbi:MAG: hypothetical protein WCK18_02345 [Prolixibacteraceae bacterium]
MNKLTGGLIISFGFGSAFGIVIYDYFVHGNIDWIRSLLVGIFVAISLIAFNWISSSRK